MTELALVCCHGGIALAYGCKPFFAICDGLVVILLSCDDIKVHGMTISSSHIRIVYVDFHKCGYLIGIFRVIFRLHAHGMCAPMYGMLLILSATETLNLPCLVRCVSLSAAVYSPISYHRSGYL